MPTLRVAGKTEFAIFYFDQTEQDIRALLDANKALKSQSGPLKRLVEDYTFKTWPISAQKSKGNQRFTFGPLGRDFGSSVGNRLIAVEENYCDVAYCKEFLVISDIQDSVHEDPEFPRLADNSRLLDPIKVICNATNCSLPLSIDRIRFVSRAFITDTINLWCYRRPSGMMWCYHRRMSCPDILTPTTLKEKWRPSKRDFTKHIGRRSIW